MVLGTYLDIDERMKIELLISQGLSTPKICKALGRSITCIYQEIGNNGGRQNYKAIEANKRSSLSRTGGRSYSRRVYTDEQIAYLKDALSKKVCISVMANRLGTARITLKKYLQSIGVEVEHIKYSGFESRISALEAQVGILVDQFKEFMRN